MSDEHLISQPPSSADAQAAEVGGVHPAFRGLIPSSFDDVTKVAAAFVAATYVIGMLVVILQQARHGVWATDIVKPRAFGAGALFVLSWLLGTFLARHYMPSLWSLQSTETTRVPWRRAVTEIAIFVGACFFVSMSASSVLFSLKFYPPWHYLVLFVIFVLTIAVDPSWLGERKWIAYSILLGTIVVGLLYVRGPIASMVFWLVIGAFNTTQLRDLTLGLWKGNRQPISGVLFLTVSAGMLTIFSALIYEEIVPQFGGGKPPEVTVHLSSDTPHGGPMRPIDAYLLDENQHGFYLLRSRSERQAFFIPRAIVSSVDHRADDVYLSVSKKTAEGTRERSGETPIRWACDP